MSTILRVREPFSVTINGNPFGLNVGDLVSSDEAIVKGREHLFDDLEQFVVKLPAAESRRRFGGRHTETATAAPGEVRNLGPKPVAPPTPAAPPVEPQAKKKED